MNPGNWRLSLLANYTGVRSKSASGFGPPNNTLRSSAYKSMFLIQNTRIANAYELAAGSDPSDVSFDQGKMRKLLV